MLQSELEKIYDIPSAHAQLITWGWPQSDLSVRQVRGWAERKKAPFFKNPINNRLYIRESDLKHVYNGTLTGGDSHV